MAVSKQDKANLAKKLVDAGGDPKEAAKFAGAKADPNELSPKEIEAFRAGEAKGRKKAEPSGTETPSQQAASPPEPEPKKLPKVVSGAGSSMSTTKSQRIIFGVVLFATGMTIFGDVLEGRNSVTDAIPRRVAAGTIAGIMLMLLAIPMPKVASSLAGVIGIASLFVNPNGQKVLEAISKIGRTPKGSGSSAGENEVTRGNGTDNQSGAGSGGGARVK